MSSDDQSSVPNLTASSSTLSSSSNTTISNYSTPAAARPVYMIVEAIDATVTQLFLQTNHSPPPKDLGDTLVSEVKTASNQMLAPIKKTWGELSELQKVKLSFLHMKNFVKVARATLGNMNDNDADKIIAQAAWDSLNEEHYFGRRLSAFIQKGGDVTPQEGDVLSSV